MLKLGTPFYTLLLSKAPFIDEFNYFRYDHGNPLMKYQLDMDKPYERAILLNLLHLVATHHRFSIAFQSSLFL